MPEVCCLHIIAVFYFTEKGRMIYLENIRKPQLVYIPKTGLGSAGKLVLTFMSTVGLSVPYVQDVADDGLSSRYWRFHVSLPEWMVDGSYEYSLDQGGVRISVGCLVVGEDGQHPVEYHKNIEYRQYGE